MALATVVVCSALASVAAIIPVFPDRPGSPASDKEAVHEWVKTNANATFREGGLGQGYLPYPWLCPSGPYYQLWDWDSVFMGVGLLPFGSAPYLAGSMKNFFHHTNISTGEVKGALTVNGTYDAVYHAKPVLIQGAWLASEYLNDPGQFRKFRPQMQALLDYWHRPPRVHKRTGLFLWHDQMETGADQLVTSVCPSFRSKCWDETRDAYTLASADLHTFLYREHVSFANFLEAWAQDDPEYRQLREEAAQHRGAADNITKIMNEHLWREDKGVYAAYNVSGAGSPILNRVYLMGFPLWAGIANASQAATAIEQLSKPDMLSRFGIRSTSSKDARYNNDNEMLPYSNWRGPVWVLANGALTYGMAQYGHSARAKLVADRVVATLAADLRNAGSWHECYNAENGTGLAADGFLSWNTLAATLQDNLAAGVNPFSLHSRPARAHGNGLRAIV